MKRMKTMKPIQWIAIAGCGLLLGVLGGMVFRELEPRFGATVTIPDALETLPAFHYVDLDGNTRQSAEWQDKIVVLNFWATWCPPCRTETPVFVELQREYQADNVQFIGIAVDDRALVQTFADTYGINYPILLGDLAAMDLSRKLGNRFEALPHTVVIAPGGKVAFQHHGGISRAELQPVLQRLIAEEKAGEGR